MKNVNRLKAPIYEIKSRTGIGHLRYIHNKHTINPEIHIITSYEHSQTNSFTPSFHSRL